MMRTRDLTDPHSWRAWDGEGFGASLFATPFDTPAPDPAKANRIWACAFCDTINQPQFLACGNRKCSATKKEAERPAEWGALTPSEARELYE